VLGRLNMLGRLSILTMLAILAMLSHAVRLLLKSVFVYVSLAGSEQTWAGIYEPETC